MTYGTERRLGESTLADDFPQADGFPPLTDLTAARLTPCDVAHLLRTYLEPACFPPAVHRLAQRHLLALVGPEATGRRLGAIALLSRMPLAEGSITILSPVTTVAGLVARMPFEPGRAYLLPDWPLAGQPLTSLAHALAEIGAYLVVTHTPPPRSAEPTELHHPWSPPPGAGLFDLCLATFGLPAHRHPADVATARELAATLVSPAAIVALATQITRLDTPLAGLLPAEEGA
ncbi:hypothetical protein [Nonomuraea sp. SBT364]|uniref:hypothetical protein n=1 Tax=Nonomuraea sp. SBT364 TaxID=1580530 RepID=UPI00066C542B|nr:hypothetical protein [Nonomuraea sp. SBT364]